MSSKYLVSLSVAFLLVFLPIFPAKAQIDANIFSNLSIVLSPEFPNPGEIVTATIDDYSIGGTGNAISWRINGETQTDANNHRSITFDAPRAGESLTVSASLSGTSGSHNTSRTITPYFLDLVVEPQTYTPYFYKGAAMPIFGSQVLLTALLHTQNGPVDASQYTYRWRLGTAVVNGGPVRGGFQTYVTLPQGRNHTISVDVQNNSGTIIARKTINIPVVDIEVQFYEYDALYGLHNRALRNGQPFVGSNMNIQAVPYYMDNLRSVSEYNMEWRVNNRLTGIVSDNPLEINLGANTQSINFKIRNTKALLQGGEASLNFSR